MDSNGMDGKETKGTGRSPAPAAAKSPKLPWQTPEMIEEDYRETEKSLGSSDFDIYS
jgi:hypothetical protein